MTLPDHARTSIVVLTFNRRDEVLGTLRRLASTTPGAPVIVVDNGSQDGTADAIRRHFPRVTLIAARWNHGAAGRNLGVEAVQTPYVAFCDDDTCWEPGAIDLAADILDGAPAVAVINARVLVGAAGVTDPTCELMAHSPLGRIAQGSLLLGFMAGACVMRTESFRAVGGYWRPFFIGGEETLLALDIAAHGWQMVYARDVVTRHFPSPQRDAGQRRHLLVRNAIWTAWLRLPLGTAVHETLHALRAVPAMRARWHALRDALAGADEVLRNRHVVPAHVERMHSLLRAHAAEPAARVPR